MSKVVLDVSVSLDGFMAGPNVREAEPMGDGGELLHAWMFGKDGPEHDIDAEIRRSKDSAVGAAVIGRHTFDLGIGPWGGTPWRVPSFVITHRLREDLLGNNGGVFAFDGLQSAVRRAKEAAGDKHVFVLGGDVARQILRAGLLDELNIHLVPILLGGGTPLFAGERAELVAERRPVAGTVTHFRFRVGRVE